MDADGVRVMRMPNITPEDGFNIRHQLMQGVRDNTRHCRMGIELHTTHAARLTHTHTHTHKAGSCSVRRHRALQPQPCESAAEPPA